MGACPPELLVIEGTTIGMLPDHVVDDGFHEAELEVERSLDAPEGQSQQSVA